MPVFVRTLVLLNGPFFPFSSWVFMSVSQLDSKLHEGRVCLWVCSPECQAHSKLSEILVSGMMSHWDVRMESPENCHRSSSQMKPVWPEVVACYTGASLLMSLTFLRFHGIRYPQYLCVFWFSSCFLFLKLWRLAHQTVQGTSNCSNHATVSIY